MRVVLTVAGSDTSAGAGIQQDLKTITALGQYALTVPTALTAQNTVGVRAVMPVPEVMLGEQLDAVMEDFEIDAVKIGMVASSELIHAISEKLLFYKARNIVVDPVMVATSGSALLKTDAIDTLTRELLPIATLVTPNIPEAEILSDSKIETADDMRAAAKKIGDHHPSIQGIFITL